MVCLSDTHGMHDEIVVPEGDLLIHAGDLTGRGTSREVTRVAEWLADLNHRHKLVIAGNHDFLFESDSERGRALIESAGATYLQDEGVEIDGVHFWGSPWQPWFHDWAFNLARGEPLRRVWAKIPPATDVLITHGPPFGMLDRVARTNEPVGCEALTERLRELDVRLHVFGHIHEAYGVDVALDGRLSINASIATLRYEPTQEPVVVDWCEAFRTATIV
ncbi:metallophosphatase domain-containing protein [Saltatorellus ferox]